MDALKNYSNPRAKVTQLLKAGEIIQLRKGLYVFSLNQRKNVLSREIAANLIYGPSYVSLEYALSYYGLIPEKVTTVTSVTTGRSRVYETLIGLFSYRTASAEVYSIGIDLIKTESGSFHIATPVKALADKSASESGYRIQSIKKMKEYLINNLRIDESALKELPVNELAEIAEAYKSERVDMLLKTLKVIKDE